MTCKIVLSGPFCSGKTSIIHMLEEKYHIPKLIDDSTRPMRPGERADFPYHFISEEEFQRRERDGYYFETVRFNGHFYGVPNNALIEQRRWSLDVLSASWPRYQRIPGVIGIYLEPPSVEVLASRARARGDSEEHIANRIRLMNQERGELFPYRIPPQPSLEATLAKIEEILKGIL